ncbi:MAG: peroxiredoxin [Acidimicrobiales bacterium]|nr:peroxiredoxin [Acidimicrobiales bacterium]
MSISVGDRVPDVEVRVMGDDGMPQAAQSGELLGSGKVVLFAVPGAFTPGCSKVHLPGFVAKADQLAGKGVDSVVCTAVNDAWVMDAWQKDQSADAITMMADGNGAFAAAMGLVLDVTGAGLGTRSKRYAAIIEDGVVTSIEVDEGGIELSTCDAVLERL